MPSSSHNTTPPPSAHAADRRSSAAASNANNNNSFSSFAADTHHHHHPHPHRYVVPNEEEGAVFNKTPSSLSNKFDGRSNNTNMKNVPKQQSNSNMPNASFSSSIPAAMTTPAAATETNRKQRRETESAAADTFPSEAAAATPIVAGDAGYKGYYRKGVSDSFSSSGRSSGSSDGIRSATNIKRRSSRKKQHRNATGGKSPRSRKSNSAARERLGGEEQRERLKEITDLLVAAHTMRKHAEAQIRQQEETERELDAFCALMEREGRLLPPPPASSPSLPLTRKNLSAIDRSYNDDGHEYDAYRLHYQQREQPEEEEVSDLNDFEGAGGKSRSGSALVVPLDTASTDAVRQNYYYYGNNQREHRNHQNYLDLNNSNEFGGKFDAPTPISTVNESTAEAAAMGHRNNTNRRGHSNGSYAYQQYQQKDGGGKGGRRGPSANSARSSSAFDDFDVVVVPGKTRNQTATAMMRGINNNQVSSTSRPHHYQHREILNNNQRENASHLRRFSLTKGGKEDYGEGEEGGVAAATSVVPRTSNTDSRDHPHHHRERAGWLDDAINRSVLSSNHRGHHPQNVQNNKNIVGNGDHDSDSKNYDNNIFIATSPTAQLSQSRERQHRRGDADDNFHRDSKSPPQKPNESKQRVTTAAAVLLNENDDGTNKYDHHRGGGDTSRALPLLKEERSNRVADGHYQDIDNHNDDDEGGVHDWKKNKNNNRNDKNFLSAASNASNRNRNNADEQSDGSDDNDTDEFEESPQALECRAFIIAVNENLMEAFKIRTRGFVDERDARRSAREAEERRAQMEKYKREMRAIDDAMFYNSGRNNGDKNGSQQHDISLVLSEASPTRIRSTESGGGDNNGNKHDTTSASIAFMKDILNRSRGNNINNSAATISRTSSINNKNITNMSEYNHHTPSDAICEQLPMSLQEMSALVAQVGTVMTSCIQRFALLIYDDDSEKKIENGNNDVKKAKNKTQHRPKRKKTIFPAPSWLAAGFSLFLDVLSLDPKAILAVVEEREEKNVKNVELAAAGKGGELQLLDAAITVCCKKKRDGGDYDDDENNDDNNDAPILLESSQKIVTQIGSFASGINNQYGAVNSNNNGYHNAARPAATRLSPASRSPSSMVSADEMIRATKLDVFLLKLKIETLNQVRLVSRALLQYCVAAKTSLEEEATLFSDSPTRKNSGNKGATASTTTSSRTVFSIDPRSIFAAIEGIMPLMIAAIALQNTTRAANIPPSSSVVDKSTKTMTSYKDCGEDDDEVGEMVREMMRLEHEYQSAEEKRRRGGRSYDEGSAKKTDDNNSVPQLLASPTLIGGFYCFFAAAAPLLSPLSHHPEMIDLVDKYTTATKRPMFAKKKNNEGQQAVEEDDDADEEEETTIQNIIALKNALQVQQCNLCAVDTIHTIDLLMAELFKSSSDEIKGREGKKEDNATPKRNNNDDYDEEHSSSWTDKYFYRIDLLLGGDGVNANNNDNTQKRSSGNSSSAFLTLADVIVASLKTTTTMMDPPHEHYHHNGSRGQGANTSATYPQSSNHRNYNGDGDAAAPLPPPLPIIVVPSALMNNGNNMKKNTSGNRFGGDGTTPSIVAENSKLLLLRPNA